MSEQVSLPARGQGHRGLLIVLFAGFVLSGIATTILGPMLPVFIRRWSLDDGQAGLFSMILFSAAWAGTLASSAISARRGYRPALLIGYALIGGGLFFLNADTPRMAMTATGAFGLGYGLITPGTNLFVAELGGRKSASLLNLLNFSWGVGAMMCSPLVAAALRRNQVSSLLTGFAVFGGLLVLGMLVASFGKQEQQTSAKTEGPSLPGIGIAITIALAALFFIYVAVENGIGIWAAEYAKRLAHGITSLTTLAPMFFYFGLTAGRLTAPLVLLRVAERSLVLGALCLTAAATVSLIASTTLTMAIVAVFFAGLGCASVYPIFIAWLSHWYGPRAKKIGGVLFAIASLGGSTGPGLVGLVSQLSASLRIGFIVPLFGIVVMVCLVVALRRQTVA